MSIFCRAARARRIPNADDAMNEITAVRAGLFVVFVVAKLSAEVFDRLRQPAVTPTTAVATAVITTAS